MLQNLDEEADRLKPFAKDAYNELFLEAVNKVLVCASLPSCLRTADPGKLPIIYVVGAPRSGTTLVSQLLSRYLEVGYINNLIARFWLRPSVGIQLSSILLGAERRRGIVFESEHGVTFGPAGPHEFGYFWSHWLRLSDSPTHHLNDGALGRIDRDGLQKALEQEILGSFNVPVVFKNVICGFQAGFLTALHPRSLFVHVKRSPFAVAASVLGCRFQRYGSYATWWSLKPSTFPELSLLSDPASQVVGQVLDCVAEIEEELDNSEVKSLVLSYEKLCADPEGSITQVFRACEEMDCMVTRNDDPLPRLVMASPQRLSLEHEDGLKNALNDRGIAV